MVWDKVLRIPPSEVEPSGLKVGSHKRESSFQHRKHNCIRSELAAKSSSCSMRSGDRYWVHTLLSSKWVQTADSLAS